MKCINFEICKRLYDNWLLSFNWLDYSWYFRIDSEWNSLAICKHNSNYNEYLEQYIKYPALNSEDAIKFIKNSKYNWHKIKIDIQEKYIITYEFKRFDTTTFKEKTLLCCLEKLIEYLLDNNLLQQGIVDKT